MAIITPPRYQIVDPALLVGRAGFDSEPVETILENTNWLYKNHTPPLYNAAPINDPRATTTDFFFPLVASADNLDYTLYAYVYTDISAGVDLSFYTSGTVTTGSPWGSAHTSHSFGAASGGRWVSVALPLILTGTKFGRTVWSPQVASGATVQVQAIMIVPNPPAPTVGSYASGFIPIDSAHISSSDAAIHTEYFDRALHNCAAVLQDRRQCVLAYQQMASGGDRLSASGSHTIVPVFAAQTHVHGEQGSFFVVRMRADDAGANAEVTVYEAGTSNSVTLAADGVDRAAVLTLSTPQPTLVCQAKPASGTSIRYLTMDWGPTSIP